MEKKKVCISMTAQEIEALSSFAKKQNELSSWVWTKILEEALKDDLIKIKETSPKKPSKPKERYTYDTPVELLKELISTDEFVEEDIVGFPKQDLDLYRSIRDEAFPSF